MKNSLNPNTARTSSTLEALIAEEKAEKKAAKVAKQNAGFAAKSEPEFRTTTDGFYGEGRVYAATSGATHYMGADGSYSTEIWDQD